MIGRKGKIPLHLHIVISTSLFLCSHFDLRIIWICESLSLSQIERSGHRMRVRSQVDDMVDMVDNKVDNMVDMVDNKVDNMVDMVDN